MSRHIFSDVWLYSQGALRSLTPETMFRDPESRDRVNNVGDAYSRVAWVYRCVQLRSQLIGALPYTIQRGENQEIPFADFPWLLRRIEFALCLWGAAYLLRQKRGSLQWLNPQTMTVETNASGLSGFTQAVGTERRHYSLEDIVYLAQVNPSDDLGPGISPAQVCLDAATLAWAANTYTRLFFQHGAVPAVILTSETPLSESSASRLKQVWDSLFEGVRKSHRTAVLPPGIKPQVIGAAAKDVLPQAILTEARRQIAVAFGIPQTLLEDAANFATAREHKLSLYRETLIPEAEFIRDELNEQFFGPQGLELIFHYEDIEALQQDEASKAAALTQLVESGIMSGDEAREQLGLAPRAEPVSPEETPAEAPAAAEAAPGLTAEARAELARWRRKAQRGKKEFESAVLPAWVLRGARWCVEHFADDPLAGWLRRLDRGKAEDTMARDVARVLEDNASRIIAKAKRGEMPEAELKQLQGDLSNALTPLLTRLVVDATLDTAAEAGVELALDEVLSDAAAWASQYTYDLVKGITETQREVLQKVISQLANNQIDAAGAEGMLGTLFGPVRARMIAVTEVTRATSQATVLYQQAVKELGLESVRRWLTAEDEKVCPICGALDHKTEDVWRGEYPDGPPAHVNCRCVAVLEWVKK